MSLKQNFMERKETYPPEAIFQLVNEGIKKHDFDGDIVKLKSQRYRTFLERGTTCVDCGIEGTFFAKERHMLPMKKKNGNGRTIATNYVLDEATPFHFNLYGINKHGHEVLMTKDHIIPRAKDGKDYLSNYQTMCKKCNEKKGSSMPKSS